MSSSKRRLTAGNSSRPVKRRKTARTQTDDDLPTIQSQNNAPSSSSMSSRLPPASATIQSLGSLCIHVFVKKLKELSKDPDLWEHIRWWLKALPDNLVTRVFTALTQTCPALLNHAFITAFFLRGASIVFTSEMGVKNLTISAVASSDAARGLHELAVSGFPKISDAAFASAIHSLPSLRILVLRECTKVGPVTVAAAAKHCLNLTTVNLNYTSVTPVSLAPLLLGCRDLQVLKVAGIQNWTDAAFAKLWTAMGPLGDIRLLKLRSLKLRHAEIGDATLNTILTICPEIRRLDVSFTNIHHPPLLLTHKILEKLSLTSTAISSSDLLAIVSNLPELRTLSIGAIGSSGSRSDVSTIMAMREETLFALTQILEHYPHLESVNMVGNSKLCTLSSAAMAVFIQRVGKKCKTLNLANIPALSSNDLCRLLPQDGVPSCLQTLILTNTAVDDEAGVFIASCPYLETLDLAGTKLTNTGLYHILDNCPRLVTLDLTSCRGVKVADRRRFFEVWEQDRKEEEEDNHEEDRGLR